MVYFIIYERIAILSVFVFGIVTLYSEYLAGTVYFQMRMLKCSKNEVIKIYLSFCNDFILDFLLNF